jgi:hypothetical protein
MPIPRYHCLVTIPLNLSCRIFYLFQKDPDSIFCSKEIPEHKRWLYTNCLFVWIWKKRSRVEPALYLCTANALYRKFETNIPRNETGRPLSPISTFICLWAIYIHIPTIGSQMQCSKIGRPTMGIYKSLTGTWMQKLGTRPRAVSFLGIFASIFGSMWTMDMPLYINLFLKMYYSHSIGGDL